MKLHEKEGIALGALTQSLGPGPLPVAYLSRKLDPTARGGPPCLQNLAAIAILTQDTLKLFWGQTNYYYQPPSETTPKWKRPYSNVDGKSRPDYITF